MIKNSLVVHNSEPTFFRNSQKSCIDHILSNCPTKISNIRTHINDNSNNYTNIKASIINNDNATLSVHALLSWNYNSKDIHIPQQFKSIRNYRLLTKDKLQSMISNNNILNSIFSETDPNIIANSLISELTNIIEILSPSKKVQCKKKFAP